VAKCTGQDQHSYTAIGWRGARVELFGSEIIGCNLIRESVWSVDPAADDWHLDAAEPTNEYWSWASTGSSVVVSYDIGLLVIDLAGRTRIVPNPKGLYSWGVVSATVDGGYVVGGGAPNLVRLKPDLVTVSVDPVPRGYVVDAPTSDPTRFIVDLASEAAEPYGLKGAHHVYLWDREAGTVKLLAPNVVAVSASRESLAFLTLDSGVLESLTAAGTLRGVANSAADVLQSPDGRFYVDADPGSDSAQTVTLRDSTTHGALASVMASIGFLSWSGSKVAFVPRGVETPSALVVLEPGQSITVPFPSG
jgi:hypothetical protein